MASLERSTAAIISLLVIVLASCVILVSCSATSDERALKTRPSDWQPILGPLQVGIVREVFPDFQPELFESLPPDPSLTPQNFSPAVFFPALAGQLGSTPGGIPTSAKGFDSSSQIELLPAAGTYFDRQGGPYTFSLDLVSFYPQWNLESRMGLPPTPGALRIDVDRRRSRIDLAEIDRIMLDVREAVATRVPQAANVDPRRAQIVFEPTIFFVSGSNFGNTWAGGETRPLGGGSYQIRVLFFYINSQKRVMDWREFLIHEAINFYVLSAGRPDLAI